MAGGTSIGLVVSNGTDSNAHLDVSGFPKEKVLDPMTADYAGAPLDFFRGIPAEDRFYFKEGLPKSGGALGGGTGL